MNDKVKVFTAFSGYDSQCMALEMAGVEYDLVGWSEIDKYAIALHNACFPQFANRNFGDISKIDWSAVPDFDLFTYSFPCTDISQAGQQKGLTEGSGTRSSLLWECTKAIEAKRPKFLMMENVKALTSEKFIKHFNKWEQWLAGLGYENYCMVINAKDYIPQNRERIFVVSVLDGCVPFAFGKPKPMTKVLKDMLEEHVDDKYYLAEESIAGFLDNQVEENSEEPSLENTLFDPSWQ